MDRKCCRTNERIGKLPASASSKVVLFCDFEDNVLTDGRGRFFWGDPFESRERGRYGGR